jgi:hypothetical protein
VEQVDTDQAVIAVRAIIKNLETALIALADPTITSYSLDTGQSVQRVTRRDISRLTADLESAYSLLATLQARSTGRGSIQVVPVW